MMYRVTSQGKERMRLTGVERRFEEEQADMIEGGDRYDIYAERYGYGWSTQYYKDDTYRIR
jgi:hypothetical protein